MTTSADAKARIVAAYDAAADTYDDPANAFWARFGRRTIDRLHLRAGDRVLDACCGSGASAIPAAEAVGPGGTVLGIDLSERLIALGRGKASARGLRQLDFRTGDLLDLQVPDASFDAAVCVFGIFFVPDMPAAIRSLRRALRPGGRLAITTWGPRFFEPATTAFWDAVRRERTDLYKGFNPWDRLTDPAAVRALLEEGGALDADVVAEVDSHPIASPEAWWAAVLGSGYRGTIDQLDPAQRERAREANLAFVRDSGLTAVEANVVYAIAR